MPTASSRSLTIIDGPGAPAITRAALDEDLLHRPREPQGDAETAPELDRETGVLAGQIHGETNVVAAVQYHLTLGLVDEAVAGARRDRVECRAEVHARLGAQHQGLAGGDQMNERQHIGDDLGDRRLLDPAEMYNPPTHRLKCRPVGLEYLSRAANENGDFAGLGAMDPSCDGTGEGGDPQTSGALREGFDFREIVGAHFDPSRAGAEDAERPIEHRLRGGGRGQTGDQAIAARGQFAHRGRPSRAGGEDGIGRTALEVMHLEREAGAGEIRRQVSAQMTESDKSVTHRCSQ